VGKWLDVIGQTLRRKEEPVSDVGGIVHLAVGVMVTIEEIERVFRREVSADSDVAPAEFPYVLKGDNRAIKKYDDLGELADAIAARVGCTQSSWFNVYDHGVVAFLFGPTLKTDDAEALVG
jgi:hypothetical protein